MDILFVIAEVQYILMLFITYVMDMIASGLSLPISGYLGRKLPMYGYMFNKKTTYSSSNNDPLLIASLSHA